MLQSTTIINARLLGALADLRHGDVVVVADAGLPVAGPAEVIDLSIVLGTPSFELVSRVVIDAMVVESAVVAEESLGCVPVDRLREQLPCRLVTHEEFKRLAAAARLIVRTGEHTPYANVALIAGVAF